MPLAPQCAGTQQMVTSPSLAIIHLQASMTATAKRWPELRVSLLTPSMAAVELKNTVYRRPPPHRWSSLVYGECVRFEDLHIGPEMVVLPSPFLHDAPGLSLRGSTDAGFSRATIILSSRRCPCAYDRWRSGGRLLSPQWSNVSVQWFEGE